MVQDGEVSLPLLILPSYKVIILTSGEHRITYKDPLGAVRTWESSERTTRPKNSDIDGVGIVAILEKESGEAVYPSFSSFFSFPLFH